MTAPVSNRPVAAPVASRPSTPSIPFEVRNMMTGLEVQKGENSIRLTGKPGAPEHTFGGILSVDFFKRADGVGASGNVFIQPHDRRSLPEVAQELAKSINDEGLLQANVTENADGSVTVDFKPQPLKTAIASVLKSHWGEADNFVNTNEARALVDLAKADGKIDPSERQELNTLMMGWTFHSDEDGVVKGAKFETPTLSHTAGAEIQRALNEEKA